jgi:SAM-dependent MidA family methyltransferase
MTRTRERLDLIEAQGPIGVADFMAACLFDPQHGYYTTREPFGREGDFTTAPEISQMFGELVGVRLLHCLAAAGSPLPATIAEIGPGRGTLMKDMARTLAKASRLAPVERASSPHRGQPGCAKDAGDDLAGRRRLRLAR